MNNSNNNNWITENPLFQTKNQRYYYDFGTGKQIEKEEVKEKREAFLNAVNGSSTNPQKQKKDDFLEGFNFYNSTRPNGTNGQGIGFLSLRNPFMEKLTREKEPKAERKAVSMPVGGDIENDDDMELFLSGMREGTACAAGNGETQKLSVITNPAERSALIAGYEKTLSQKSPSAVHKRIYEEEVNKGAIVGTNNIDFAKEIEKEGRRRASEAAKEEFELAKARGDMNPAVASMEKGDEVLAEYRKSVSDRINNARTEEKKLEKEINNLEFAKDIEAEGKRRASEAAKKEFELAKARGDMNPAVASMEKGDEVLAYYNKLASDARNGMYNYDLANEIAGYEKNREDAKFGEKAERGKATIPYSHSLTKNALGKEIVNFINDDAFAGMYSAVYKKPYDAERLSMLTEDEKNVMRAYAADGDLDSVEKYYDLLERQLNERVQNKKNEETRKKSYENIPSGVVRNVASSFGTPLAYFSNMGQAIKNGIMGDFEPTDINSPAFRATHYGANSEEGIVNRVYDTFGEGELGETVASVAHGGLSVAQDLVKTPLKKWSMPFEIFGSAGEDVYESLKQGKDSGETLASSSARGAMAAIMEKLKPDEATVENILVDAFAEELLAKLMDQISQGKK